MKKIISVLILMVVMTTSVFASAIMIEPINKDNPTIDVNHYIKRGDQKEGKPYKLSFTKYGKIYHGKDVYDTQKEYDVNEFLYLKYDKTGKGDVFEDLNGQKYALHPLGGSTPGSFGEESDDDDLYWMDRYELVKIKKVNPIKIKAWNVTLKYSKKARTISPYSYKKKFVGTKLTFKKVKGNSKIKVKKNGKIVVKGKLKKGVYKVKLKVNVKENDDFQGKTMTAKFKIRIVKK